MSFAPKSKGVPTAEQIAAYWMAAPKPSQRKVEQAMREDGWDVSASTIIRCVNSGFKPRARPKEHASPETNAILQVKSILPDDAPPSLVAEAMVEAIRNLPTGEGNRVKDLLQMEEKDLVASTRRLFLIAGHLLAEDLATHTKLMMLAPDKAAKLWQALGSSMALVMPPPIPAPGEGAKVVENDPTVLSPSAQALRDFRIKNRSAAA